MSDMEQHADLVVMMIKGMMAQAILRRGTTPTKAHWELLQAKDMTLRELAEFAYDYDYEIEFKLKDRRS